MSHQSQEHSSQMVWNFQLYIPRHPSRLELQSHCSAFRFRENRRDRSGDPTPLAFQFPAHMQVQTDHCRYVQAVATTMLDTACQAQCGHAKFPLDSTVHADSHLQAFDNSYPIQFRRAASHRQIARDLHHQNYCRP